MRRNQNTQDKPKLIAQLVRDIRNGPVEAAELASAALYRLATQQHGEHAKAIVEGGAIEPLVELLSGASAKAHQAAAGALHALGHDREEHQQAIVAAGGIEAFATLMKMGNAKVQELVATALASLDSGIAYQTQIIEAGCVPPLIALLQTTRGSAAAQLAAAHAVANAAASGTNAQNVIAKAGALPLLIQLLREGAAQKRAATALGKLAQGNPQIQTELMNSGGIPPLLSLLSGRNVEAKVEAASAVAEMARDHLGNQTAIVKAGGIGPLLGLLATSGRGSVEVQSQGMNALAQLARENRDNQDQIAKQGGIEPIVGRLNESSATVQSFAAFAIMEVARSNEFNRRSVVNHGGVTYLATLMKQSPNAEVKAEVAGALWSLSEDPEIKAVIANANTVPPLVTLLGIGNERARYHASHALASLGRDNNSIQVEITRMLLDLLSSGSRDAQTRAAWALRALVEENPTAHQVIADAGNPSLLVDLLRTGIPEAKEYSLWSLSLSIAPENQAVVQEAGGVEPLISHLVDRRGVVQEEAAAALAKLAYDNDDTRTAITKAGGIKPLIRLLDVVPTESMKKRTASNATAGEGADPSHLACQNAAEALANLAVDPAARDEIVGGGGIRLLVKVLHEDGAKAKTFVAMALARLSRDHEATQSAVAASGAIGPLVTLLDGTEGPDAQEEAAGALFALAAHELNRMAITESDGIGLLVMLLGTNNPRARAHAEGALVRLSVENSNRVLIIKKLVYMLQDSGNQSKLAAEQSAAALANLAKESQDNRKSIVEADGIPPLLTLLDSTSSKAKENSVGAIKELCVGSRTNQVAIANVGGIPKLVNVISAFSGATMKELSVVSLCTLAAAAIKELAEGNRKNQTQIAEAGAIAPLVSMLASPAPEMQANAAGALANLARGHSDNQAAIAKTGAIGPLCNLVREGSPETQDQSASAVWSLATDFAPNKDTIAKLGGIDPLVGLLIAGSSEMSQKCAASGLAALASKHVENREYIAKRLVGLLGSPAAREPAKATRVLATFSFFASDSAANQVAIAKGGGITPLIACLGTSASAMHAAHALLALATNNATTQGLIAKTNGIPPLIQLVSRGSAAAQEHAARTLWHLASQSENQVIIIENNGIKAFVGMVGADGDTAPELAAVIMVRHMRTNPDVSVWIADKGGIVPFVKLVANGSPGGRLQAAAALAELALAPRNRDAIANAGGIDPIIELLASGVTGMPETAARVLSHVAYDEELKGDKVSDEKVDNRYGRGHQRGRAKEEENQIKGSAQRRALIHQGGGIRRLIQMLDGSTFVAGKAPKSITGSVGEREAAATKAMPVEGGATKAGMQEQAAAALADIAHNNAIMQEAIIDTEGVPALLSLIRLGSQLGQEHSARALRYVASGYSNQAILVSCGTVPELVQLLKTGSSRAQEYSAAGLADLARGAIAEQEARKAKKAASFTALEADLSEEQAIKQRVLDEAKRESDGTQALGGGTSLLQKAGEWLKTGAPAAAEVAEGGGAEEEETDRLVLIADVGGIVPLIALLASSNQLARENAAGALCELALNLGNQSTIARANGILPLVNLLDDGTDQAHVYVHEALARLARDHVENQMQIAKHLVGLLSNNKAGTQQRTARALRDLAGNNPGSPVVIVNSGAISPLVNCLALGETVVKEEAAGALSTLSLNSPSTQLAIATGLVALIGTGSTETQEQTTKLLVTLAQDKDNAVAISKSGAIPRLVVQLRGGGRINHKIQELAAAVLSYLSGESDASVKAIASASGTRPLVSLLATGSSAAQAYSAAVLSDMARMSKRNQRTIVSEGAISPLYYILTGKDSISKTKAEAAGALLHLAAGSPETQKAIADAGAIKPLVQLLDEPYDLARAKAAGAIAALCQGSAENQELIEKQAGLEKLIQLLGPTMGDIVRADAAAAIAVLADKHTKTQDAVGQAGGIGFLVDILKSNGGTRVKEEVASALWSLSANNRGNQEAVANAEGIGPLVNVLGLGTVRANEQAAGALAALALDNVKNELSIANRIVALLGSDNKDASATAARAIAQLARSNPSNQTSIAQVGGIALLVAIIDTSVANDHETERPHEEGGTSTSGQHEGVSDTTDGRSSLPLLTNKQVSLQKDIAAAIWSMTNNNQENQAAVAKAGGIPPLIALLVGSKEVHRDAAGALWSLALDQPTNQEMIASSGGVQPLVNLLKQGTDGSQETAAGALHALAACRGNRSMVADAGGIPPLVTLFDGGSESAKLEAFGALRTLVLENPANQLAIAHSLVEMLKQGSRDAQERVTQLLLTLAQDPDNRASIAKAGAVPELVGQLQNGSERAMGLAASALGQIALQSESHRATVTTELVKLLASDVEAVRKRSSEALRDMAAGDKRGGTGGPKKGSKMDSSTSGGGRPLVNLLKDGLKDDNTEAQEYALWSLSSITDAVTRMTIVDAGGIRPLIVTLIGGQLSALAQEHASAVLSGLSALEDNATLIKDEGGIEPLVQLLSNGNSNAKDHAATALAQIATKANASLDIAGAGAIPAFVEWLADPELGSPGVAARALSDIALNNHNTQSQIAEEGAIPYLVAMVGASTAMRAASLSPSPGGSPSPSPSPEKMDPSNQAPNATSPVVAVPTSGSPNARLGRRISQGGPGAMPAAIEAAKLPSPSVAPAGDSPPRRARHQRMSKSAGSPIHAKSAAAIALRLSAIAAGTLATLANGNLINQIMIAEEDGIAPLVELLKDRDATYESATQALWHLAVNEENRSAIAKVGGISPLIALLSPESRSTLQTQEYTAAALAALVCDHTENQLALARAGAIDPLVSLLGSDSTATQRHAVDALLYLASHHTHSRDAVVERLVAVLESRSAAAQMKSAEALVVLASRSADNRNAITEAKAIAPLVGLLGDGRRVRSDTPQERAAAVLAVLGRSGVNKEAIIKIGGVPPLARMLSSDSVAAQTHAAATIWHLSQLAGNRDPIAEAGSILPLVELLSGVSSDAEKFASGTLWYLASSSSSRVAMVNAGAIKPLVALLASKTAETREHAAAVLSALARNQGGNKKGIYQAGAIPLLVKLLSDPGTMLQKHAASALWGLADGADGVFDKDIVEHDGVAPLIAIMQKNDPDTRGSAAACLLCVCKDKEAAAAIKSAGGAKQLLVLAHGPATWLRSQAAQMLTFLGIPIPDPDEANVMLHLPADQSDKLLAAAHDNERREEGSGDASDPGADGDGDVKADDGADGAEGEEGSAADAEEGADSSPAGTAGKRAAVPAGAVLKSTGFAVAGVVVARIALKVRAQSSLKSVEVGELPAGSRVLVTDQRQLEDGTWRMSIAHEGKAPFGWISYYAKDKRETLIAADSLAAAKATEKLHRSLAMKARDNKIPVPAHKRFKFHFFSFQVNREAARFSLPSQRETYRTPQSYRDSAPEGDHLWA